MNRLAALGRLVLQDQMRRSLDLLAKCSVTTPCYINKYSLTTTHTKRSSDTSIGSDITPNTDSSASNSLLDYLFSEEERDKILNLLNNGTAQELKARKISPALQKKIRVARPFNSFEKLLKLPRISIVAAEKLCRACLQEHETKAAYDFRKTVLKSVTPQMTPKAASEIHSITLIDLHLESCHAITMQVDPFELQDTKIIHLQNTKKYSPGRFDHAAYVDEARHIISQLPQSDAYIIKTDALRAFHGKVNFAILAIRILETAFLALAPTYDRTQKFYTVLSGLVEQAFNLRIGTEVVSTVKQTKHLLQEGQWENVTISNPKETEAILISSHKKQTHNSDKQCHLFLQSLIFMQYVLNPARKEALKTAAAVECKGSGDAPDCVTKVND